MTFTEFVDFVLVRLYELDREHGSNWVGFDVDEIAAELREPVPRGWVADAIEVLRHRGLAGAGQTDQVMGASISGEGRLYVEGRQHQTEVIEEYRREPTNFVFVSGTSNQVAVGVHGEVIQVSVPAATREQALALVGELRERLQTDDILDPTVRSEALDDVDAIEGQFQRKRINKTAVTALLGEVAQVATVTEVAVKLSELVRHIV